MMNEILIPGYITLFKDDDGFVHLYFYRGLLNNHRYYYNILNLSELERNGYKFSTSSNKDGSYEYIFENKNIQSMRCKLVSYDNKEEKILLKIK